MPVSPIERLAVRFREVLHLPDPSALYVLMGAVAANMIEGPPVWIMLVGPPSCGKTELLNSLLYVPRILEAADLASEAAFLSGTSARETAGNATGGLLKQLGTAGGLILNDFTSVLSKPRDKLSTIMAVFREAYGGRWTRHVGSDGGRSIQWVGKLALFGGVTGVIDQHHQVSAELGERWVYFRFAHHDTFHEVSMALSSDRGEWREELRQIVVEFFKSQGLSFHKPAPRREFTVPEKLRLYHIALVAVSCRSAVARDQYTHEVIATKEIELATRLTTVLAQLLVGMDVIGVPEATRWKLITKVAMDSMPLVRRRIIDAVAKAKFALTIDELQPVAEVSPGLVKRTVEDLMIHGVLQMNGQKVSFTDWMKANYRPL
jgi:hypothetical protein